MAQQRLSQIDALRGIAAMWVVLYHYTVRFDELFGHSSPLRIYIPQGRLGVHLFFMISGFVILMTLDKTERVKDFLFFRCARLYPTFWCCAALTLIALSIAPLAGREVTILHAIGNISMLPDTFRLHAIDPVYWSLEVELFFYGLMAVVVALGLRPRIVALLTGLVLLNAAFLALPGTAVELPLIIKAIRSALTLRYLHFFLFGIVCYEMRRLQLLKSEAPADVAMSVRYLAILFLCVLVSFFEAGPAEMVCSILIAALFWVASQYEVRLLQGRVLLFLGACSYPLYVLHQNVGFVSIRFFEGFGIAPEAAIALTAALVIPVATLISRYVEIPSNLYLRRRYRAWGKPPELPNSFVPLKAGNARE